MSVKFVFIFVLLLSGPVMAASVVEKEFGYFEDTLGESFYCNFRPDVGELTTDVSLEIANKLQERKDSIIEFLQSDARELKPINLTDIDAYPLAAGILKRASRQDLQKLEKIDLTECDISTKAFNVLYTAIVNRGICSKWVPYVRGSEKTLLDGLTITLSQDHIKLNRVQSSINISGNYGIHFLFAH